MVDIKEFTDMCKEAVEIREEIAEIESVVYGTDPKYYQEQIHDLRMELDEKSMEMIEYVLENVDISPEGMSNLLVNEMLELGKKMNNPDIDKSEYLLYVNKYQRLDALLEVC